MTEETDGGRVDRTVSPTVDAAVIECWRANYGLDRNPHDLHAFWASGAPAGAVLALKAAVAALERAHAWLEGDCTCPCCQEVRECSPDCTFAEDAPWDAERMAGARAAMFGG